MVGFLIIHICETFVKHETKISGSNQPLIHTIKVNDQFSEGRFVDFLQMCIRDSHSAGAPMSLEDGAPKPITPHRTAFAIPFTMRPTSS